MKIAKACAALALYGAFIAVIGSGEWELFGVACFLAGAVSGLLRIIDIS
jgi:uncharacterized membrane protein YjjP (DUF1212 family)